MDCYTSSCKHMRHVCMLSQVTFLKCGGMVLGTALHHVATDALSPFHFLQTWTAFSRHGDCATTVELPCQDRTLLRARSPPIVHPNVFSRFYPKLTFRDLLGPINCRQCPRHFSGPGRLPKAPLRRHKHLLCHKCPRVAVHLRCTSASTKLPSMPHLPGQRPSQSEATPPEPLLRQRIG